ncbi:MAG: DUF5724 domain-containing protein [Acidobacteriaceae bacterium]
MLTTEEARKQLANLADPHGLAGAEARVALLPAKLAQMGTSLLKREDSLLDRTPEKYAAWLVLRQEMDELRDRDRQKLFEALMPPIARHVDASWNLQKAGPYQTGFYRRAFRAPHHPETSRAARFDWLTGLLRTVLPYQYDLDFLTAWAPHLQYGSPVRVGLLLAAVLEGGGTEAEKTFDALMLTVRGEHPVAVMGRHITTALLCCSRPDAWEAIEKLLLAAQRQEGLRQVVLETIDFAHPEAFLRMLRLIERENLVRFAAVARAIAVWFGFQTDSGDAKWMNAALAELRENLESEPTRIERLQASDGQRVYLALWSMAFFDAHSAIETAAKTATRAEFEPRYAAVRLLGQLAIREARGPLKGAMRDQDLRVALAAANAIPYRSRIDTTLDNSLFDAFAELAVRMPKEKDLGWAIWEWNKVFAKQADIARRLTGYRGDRPWAQAAQYLPVMDANGRHEFAHALAAETKKSGAGPDERRIGLDLLGDPSVSVRAQAIAVLQGGKPSSEEALTVEPLLARKATDLRRGVMHLLLSQGRPEARASAERLTAAGDPLMRQAGREMLAALDAKKEETPGWQEGLGLYDPAQRTAPMAPTPKDVSPLHGGAAPRIMQALDALIETKREVPVSVRFAYGPVRTELFGNVRSLPNPNDKWEMPLAEEWRVWWNNRPGNLRDDDGLELPRAVAGTILRAQPQRPSWRDQAFEGLKLEVDLRYPALVSGVLRWLMLESMPTGGPGCLLDVFQTALHRVSTHYVKEEKSEYPWQDWQSGFPCGDLMYLLALCWRHSPAAWTPNDWQRFWPMARWFDQGLPGAGRHRPPLEMTLEAHLNNAASDADLFEQLVGRGRSGYGNHWDHRDLARLTRRKPDPLFVAYPQLHSFVDTCRKRILEIELARGDLATLASGPAMSINSIPEPGTVLQALAALGREPLTRGWGDGASRTAALSHFLRVCLPTDAETPEEFKKQAAALKVPKSRLIDLAVYSPQWASRAELASGIRGLEDAAFWLHAHTKDAQWQVEEQIREVWFAEVSERTPLSREELLDGAVDVTWFAQVHHTLGRGVWDQILDSAKYASSAAGHKRAELFASALLGAVTAAELAKRIRDKRHQDSVRALGLVPLKKAERVRQKELLARYEILQRFLKESRKFGAQRAASEKLAVEIGLANLARTAGYPDPQRLSWAMETEALGDLRRGSMQARSGDTTVTLSIDAQGEAQLGIEKKGKALSEVPASIRKVPEVAALRARKTQLGQQASRMRASLEDSMVRGDVFTSKELAGLREHPLMRPMLDALVFVTADGDLFRGAIADKKQDSSRIAHPSDLLASGTWSEAQQECLGKQIRQPFKQLFRELYVLTEAEREQKNYSSRYEGQQVNPQQALATVGKRGWVNVPEEGLRRTFHREGISAWVHFLEGWLTPTEVDGLTLEHVFFTRRSDGHVIELQQVNSRLFSEVMRDLDLMVSVAHRGGVDPEASASTMEMRATLIRETMSLLKIRNVRLTERHALIDGSRSAYTIHLGSGVVHRQPGGQLCIIPVHSQHRGRIFLPFADDDPKTAEVISKVLLLANDRAIQDPTILEQL